MRTSVPTVGSSLFARLARSKAAEPSDVDDEDENDDDDDEDNGEDGKKSKKSKKAKKAKKAEDDREGDEDDEDNEEPEALAARSREKARIRAIVNSPAGKKFPAAALRIALNTSLPRTEAISMIAAVTDGLTLDASSTSLRDRMSGVDTPDIGDGGERPAGNLAEQIILAGKKRRGEI